MAHDDRQTLGAELRRAGVTRRQILQFAAGLTATLALPPSATRAMAEALPQMKRQSIVWLSFQDCTGCLESLTRSAAPALESLIFDRLSLDYQETLMAAAGTAAEAQLDALAQKGGYLLLVDGSVPTGGRGEFAMIGGRSAVQILDALVPGAQAVVAVGSCSAFGGIPKAKPNPTEAQGLAGLIGGKPLINIPGCPPIPEVIMATLVHVLTFGTLPALDDQHRPLAWYGTTIHDQCYRRGFYDQGKFAHSFDDAGARAGWCLFELGCKGPVTHSACASLKWGGGTSYPIQSGHGCLGCTEPDFWDKGSFYTSLSGGTGPGWGKTALAGAAGVGLGAAAALSARLARAGVDRKLAAERRTAAQQAADAKQQQQESAK